MRAIRGFLLALAIAAAAGGAAAQEGPGGLINPQRDCQTITTCRFTSGGSYRGCISTYSCRVCKFVASGCQIGGRGRVCRTLRCSWG
jgi:hypothetical protein